MVRHRNTLTFFFFWLLLSFVISTGLAQEVETEPKDKEEQTEKPDEAENPNPYFERLVPPDRAVVRRFEQAKRLIEAQRLAEAAQLLGAILEDSVDFFQAPAMGEAAAPADRTTNKLFGDLVLETLLGFPAKAREAYTLQYETQARRLLENAVKEGSFEGVQFVARRYFPTPAGNDATFLLGIEQLDRGADEAAVLTLERLNRSRLDLARYEPTLGLSLALGQLRLGRKQEARETIDMLWQRLPEPEILLFGSEPWKPKSAEEILARLEKQLEKATPLSASAWLEQVGWRLPAGTPAQNAETAAEKPLLELLWSVPTLSKSAHQQEARTQLGALRREKQVLLPAAQPLVVGDRILARGLGELMAVDVRTGKLLWTATEPEYRIAKSVHLPFRNNFPWRGSTGGGGADINMVLRLHFWHNRVSHQLSSDGRRLFSVDGHDLRAISFSGWGQGNQPIRIGRKTFEDLRGGPGNTLSARDVETGRVLWQVGKFPYVQKYLDRILEDYEDEEKQKKIDAHKKDKDAPKPVAKPEGEQARKPDRDVDGEERFLGETWFLGAPLPLEGRLYVLGENAGQLRLIVLDADTGQLLRQLPIAVPPNSLETDPARISVALIPSASGGILLCPTALGMVVALDATTGTPIWCFSYYEPPKDGEERRNRRNMRNLPFQIGGGDDLRGRPGSGGWRMPSIMIDGSRALVAPADDATLYCLETATGKLLWKNDRIKREHALYVACVRDGKACVVTVNGMAAFDMTTGKPAWDLKPNADNAERPDGAEALELLAFPASLKPAGVGVHHAGFYYLPFTGGCLGLVDLDRAKLALLSSGGQIVTAPDTPDESQPLPGGPGLPLVDLLSDSFSPEDTSLTWTPPEETSFSRSEMTLGNLVGIRGRFFSQSAAEISCFDQRLPLERRANVLLEANPENPEGLLLLGRLRRAEGKAAEAVELFRRAVRSGGGDYASDCLRQTLLEVIRNDYESWKSAAGELEALAGFPEEYGEILYVLARGAQYDNDDGRAFLDAIQKALSLEIDHSIPVPVDAAYRTQLHRALGDLVRDLLRKPTDSPLRTALEQTAEKIFQGLNEKKNVDDFLPKLVLDDSDFTKKRFLMRPWWEEEATALSSDARRWQVFMELFRTMPVAQRAGKILDEYYERNRLFTALELGINPPVDWRLSEKPSSPLSLDDLRRLTAYLLAQENPTDALHYFRMAKNLPDSQGEELWRSGMENPAVQKVLDREKAMKLWPGGRISVQDVEQPKSGPDTQNPRGASIASILRGVQRPSPFPSNRRALPFFGSHEPFFSPYSYCLEAAQNDVHLVCSDSLGVERWRSPVSEFAPNMSEYGYFSENHIYSMIGSVDQMVYLKGCHHLLVFVRDRELIAFDTFRIDPNEGPKVLWTKTLSSRIPCRQVYSALPMSNLQSYVMRPDRGFPKESLFVGPRVICYRDGEQIYGLDPLSGQSLWSRSMPSSHCSILGDRENLFLVFPDIHQAIAVDPVSGRELASGTLPEGGLFVFGTNIVFVRQRSAAEAGNHQRPYQLHVGDLRELHQKRRRALLVSNENASGGLPSLPTYPIREELTHEAMVRQFHHDRFLATVSWTSKTLQIYDLENKCDVLGPEDDSGRRNGVRLPELTLRESRRRHDADFDVELLDDKFMVYFIEKGEVNTQWKGEVDERGVPVRRRRNAVSNQPTRNFGRGFLMLYEADGKECWTNPVRIEDWYRMLRVPEGLPVAIFVVSMTEQKRRTDGRNDLFTGIWGIDKRTGQTRFRSWVPPLPPNLSQTMLQGFRVQADPWKKEITFITPHRTVSAKFSDEKPLPEKKPEEKKTQPNLFDRMFEWFGE